jgi:phosphoglycerate dehydrogenase-like enzyme
MIVGRMVAPPLPDREHLTICFAHVAYRLGDRFVLRKTGIEFFELRTLDELEARIGAADVLVVSGLWRNELLDRAKKLRFIQSISAGTDQYAREALRARGIRLASAQGVNERAVAEHATALMLALTRQLPQARDNQASRRWRGMIADPALREDELSGKTLLIVGLGRIGSRLAALASGFGMRVIATKRNPAVAAGAAELVAAEDGLLELLPQADFVALTCPLTPQTELLFGAAAFAAMKPSAFLINVARGRVVDESALIGALGQGRIAGAALDCFWDEPLPADSPLWTFPNVLITPHSAGETRRYEDNVIDLLLENLGRLRRGEDELKNQVV